jgi:phasin family protein
MPKSGKTAIKNRAARTNTTRRKAHTVRAKARTVRASAANTSERISGPAQDVARAGLNAASENAQRFTTEATQFFFLSGKEGEEMARRSAQSIEAVTQASTVMTRSLQDLSRELITLAEEHLRRNVDALGAMSRCRSIQELIALQSEFLRDNLQHTLESTRRVAEVSTRMSNEASRTMARQANAQQRAA